MILNKRTGDPRNYQEAYTRNHTLHNSQRIMLKYHEDLIQPNLITSFRTDDRMWRHHKTKLASRMDAGSKGGGLIVKSGLDEEQ